MIFYENVSGALRYVRCAQKPGQAGIMSTVNFSNPSQTGLIYNNYAAGICWEPMT